MITSGTTSLLFGQDPTGCGTVLVVSSLAGRCACSRAARMFISRNGITRCLGCDYESKHFMVAPTECDVTDDGPDAQTAFQKAIV